MDGHTHITVITVLFAYQGYVMILQGWKFH